MKKLNLMPLVIRLSYVGMLLSLPLAASAVDNPLIKGYCGSPPPNSWFEFSSSAYADVKAQLISTLTQHAFADYPAAVARWFASNGGATRQGSGCQIQLHASDPLPPITYCPDLSSCAVSLNGDTWSTCGSAESTHSLNTFVRDYGGCYFSYATAPEQYTVALVGLGGEVMPTKTRNAYALVAASTGAPKSGIHVDLFHDVVPELKGQLPVTYTGILVPGDGFTDANGRMDFEFRAPTAGGTHTITATCTGCTNQATGTIKVSGCPVKDLPPITDPEVQLFEDNPDLSDETRLTAPMKDALRLLRAAVTAAGSSSTVGSAYRPPAYNQHLIDVWKKWVDELITNEKPACAALKTKIQAHFKRHKLKESQGPVPGSRHTRGEAVDVTISPDIPNIDTLARDCCNLRRPVPVDDPVHFQFP